MGSVFRLLLLKMTKGISTQASLLAFKVFLSQLFSPKVCFYRHTCTEVQRPSKNISTMVQGGFAFLFPVFPKNLAHTLCRTKKTMNSRITRKRYKGNLWLSFFFRISLTLKLFITVIYASLKLITPDIYQWSPHPLSRQSVGETTSCEKNFNVQCRLWGTWSPKSNVSLFPQWTLFARNLSKTSN